MTIDHDTCHQKLYRCMELNQFSNGTPFRLRVGLISDPIEAPHTNTVCFSNDVSSVWYVYGRGRMYWWVAGSLCQRPITVSQLIVSHWPGWTDGGAFYQQRTALCRQVRKHSGSPRGWWLSSLNMFGVLRTSTEGHKKWIRPICISGTNKKKYGAAMSGKTKGGLHDKICGPISAKWQYESILFSDLI